MLKKIILFILSVSFSFALTLEPTTIINTAGGVSDVVYKNNNLYIATKAGEVNIYSIKSKKIIQSIKLAKIKDFMGDETAAKIYSIDVLKNKILILSQGSKGGRNIFLYEDNDLKEIISANKKMYIARAKFINQKTISFALLSNQIYLYDLISKKDIYIKQISQSKFSYFKLNENKSEMIIADESGNLKKLDIKTGKITERFKDYNLDNVFQVDYKNDVIITAGQDRRAVVYNQGKTYYKQVQFLIYSCALSPSGQVAAFASDEDNNVTVFNTKNKNELYTLTGTKMTLSNILFINEKEIFVSSDANSINYYKLKD